MTLPFVHLHTHTEYSFLDGAIRISDLIAKAVQFGMPAAAITDHGGLFGAIEFYEGCIKAKIKPILGMEAYLTHSSRFDKHSATQGKEGKNDHLVLLAYNEIGWKNLMYLSTVGYLEGFYYKPRIDMKVLSEHAEGLIASTACIAGSIPRAILNHDLNRARTLSQQFLNLFGEGNFYFELQNHGITEETIVFKEMISLGKELGIPFIVTNDAHYLLKEDAKAHEVLLCIETQELLSNPNHYKFSSDEIYFKSPEEMAQLFPDIPEAISNTIAIAERCNVKVHTSPQLPVPEFSKQFSTIDEYLRHLGQSGLQEKYKEITPLIKDRFEYELKIIQTMGFAGYFLIIRDFLMRADELGIIRGCRGSAAGSIIAYCIGITNVDPIKFDLLFERFLNPERISMPDVDIDISDNDRYRIIDYVVEKYGRESVCQIINFGRMKAKAVVKDVARVMGVSVAESNKLSTLIDEKTLESSIEASQELKNLIASNPTYQEMVTYAKVLEGLARQPGMHAGGVIIAPSEVVNWSPLFKQSKNDIVMTQFDMKYVEQVGLIKIDILGLRTLTVLQEACRLIENYHQKKIQLWSLPDGDAKTYQLMHAGETTDIFQFESSGMQDYLRKLKPTCIEDLIAMTALYRPGPMANIDSFIKRKHGHEPIDYAHPMLKEILDVTYGIIVYQEQVMRIAQKMGGFSLGQADILRKAMGKKQADKMEQMKLKFVEGAVKQGISEKIANEVYALIYKFAEYGFNKAHATVYAHVSYQAAFLKAHYPMEYMTSVLTSHIGEKDKFLNAKNEAQRLGLLVMPPDINTSEITCVISNGKICLGLAVIANIGKAAEQIIANRQKSGTFKSIYNLCCRVDIRIVNKKALESLIMAGAMDSLTGTRAQLFAAVDKALEYGSSFQKDRISGQTNLFGDLLDTNNATQGVLAEPVLPTAAPWPYGEMLLKEKEVLNFYMSGHPLDNFKDELKAFATHSSTSVSEQSIKDGTSVCLGGMISSVKKITQKNGKLMAFATLEDFDSTIELVVFAEAFIQYSHLLAEDCMVLVRGTIQKKESDAEPKLIVEKVMALSETREKLTSSIHIKMNTQGLEEGFIAEIQQFCKENTGTCRLILHLATDSHNELLLYSRNIQISSSRHCIETLRSKLGTQNVWISQKAA